MFGQQAAVGNSKPVCNYYLKGNCKYGARCWNFHPPNQGGTTMSNTFQGGGSSHVFGGKNTAQQDPKKEFQDFVKQVSGEMTQWERSGQWLVSSFSPIKGHPPFSGFNDTSPEEFRIKAYEALKTNTSGAYQAHWSEMQQRFKQLREAVKMSTQEAIQAMREVFFTKSTTEAQPEQQQTLKQPSLFGKPTGQNVFGGTSQSSGGGAGLLGAKPQPSVFGATTSVFGGSQAASSVFGGSTSKPVFGTQGMMGAQNMGSFPVQSSNIFGGGGGGGSGTDAFKSGSQNTQASTLFGGTQNQTTTSSMFGASPSVAPVQGQTTSNMFGEQNKGAGSNIFSSGSQNQASVFGRSGTPAAPNTIGGQGNIFGNQPQSQQQSGLYGNQPAQQQQQTGSVFGSASVFGSNPTPTTLAQAAPQPSVFGGASGASAATVFGSTTGKKSGNIFGGSGGGFVGNTQPGSRLFGNSATSNVFANAAASASTNTSTGLFGKPADSTQPSVAQGTSNFFGELIQSNQSYSVSVSVAREHPEWYTPLDQLKPEEKAEFEADRFTLIPLCPPPVELCA